MKRPLKPLPATTRPAATTPAWIVELRERLDTGKPPKYIRPFKWPKRKKKKLPPRAP